MELILLQQLIIKLSYLIDFENRLIDLKNIKKVLLTLIILLMFQELTLVVFQQNFLLEYVFLMKKNF